MSEKKVTRAEHNPYYWTCQHCGANLDHGEICDCSTDDGLDVNLEESVKLMHENQQEPLFETYTSEADQLIIGFDSGSGDIPVLSVCRRTSKGMKVLNVVYGEAAIELYNALVTFAPPRKVQRI